MEFVEGADADGGPVVLVHEGFQVFDLSVVGGYDKDVSFRERSRWKWISVPISIYPWFAEKFSDLFGDCYSFFFGFCGVAGVVDVYDMKTRVNIFEISFCASIIRVKSFFVLESRYGFS